MMLMVKDFYPYIRETNLNEVVNDKDYFLKEVMEVAEAEARQYTSTYFENDCLYPTLDELMLDSEYTPDEIFYYSDDIYTTVATFSVSDFSELETKLSDGDVLIRDNRDKYLKMILIDITLYHVYSRISPHQIPELRVVRYDQAISKLVNIKEGLYGGLSTSCRRKDENDVVYNFMWGGDIQINNKW